MQILRLQGAEIEAHWQELAALRLQVFYEYPYLYEGDLNYERDYLKTYWESPDSLAVLVVDQGKVVGATTSLPLAHEHDEFVQPFKDAGLDPELYYYLGESVLLPEYRGQGFGHRFFDEREQRARELKRFRYSCFCAVQRSAGHPLRPDSYRELAPFWRARGYVPDSGLVARYAWKDRDSSAEDTKSLMFWVRPLRF